MSFLFEKVCWCFCTNFLIVDCEYDFATATDCDIDNTKLLNDFDLDDVMKRTLKIEIRQMLIKIKFVNILKKDFAMIIMVRKILLKYVQRKFQKLKEYKKY